jgi:hypothetical protein
LATVTRAARSFQIDSVYFCPLLFLPRVFNWQIFHPDWHRDWHWGRLANIPKPLSQPENKQSQTNQWHLWLERACGPLWLTKEFMTKLPNCSRYPPPNSRRLPSPQYATHIALTSHLPPPPPTYLGPRGRREAVVHRTGLKGPSRRSSSLTKSPGTPSTQVLPYQGAPARYTYI